MSERKTGDDGFSTTIGRPSVVPIPAADGRHFFQFEGDSAKPQTVLDYVKKGIPAEKSIVPNMNA